MRQGLYGTFSDSVPCGLGVATLRETTDAPLASLATQRLADFRKAIEMDPNARHDQVARNRLAGVHDDSANRSFSAQFRCGRSFN